MIDCKNTRSRFWTSGNKAFVGCSCGELRHGGIQLTYETPIRDWPHHICLNVETYAPIYRFRDRLKHAWHMFRFGEPGWAYFEIHPDDAKEAGQWLIDMANQSEEEAQKKVASNAPKLTLQELREKLAEPNTQEEGRWKD